MIPFNKPLLIGHELDYIKLSIESGKISGDGIYTKKCHAFFENRYGFHKTFLTTSCTDALEMAAILLEIGAGDEVIVPSYTFVSTANAFALRGANIVFADSESTTPNIDASLLESLITTRTKAIVVVHYAGVACDLGAILSIANRHGIPIIEDAAQAIESYYYDKPLGSLGKMGTFSFHETKNLISGEGGLLCVNDPLLVERAEIIREKGTNRTAFFRGDINKYEWVDIGSSFLPSDIIAAYLFAQLEMIDIIQARRKAIWALYQQQMEPLAKTTDRFTIPFIPHYATNNGHMYYLVCDSLGTRTALIDHLRNNDVLAVFHYQALHKSQFYAYKHDGRQLPNSDRYTDCLVRLPLYYDLSVEQVNWICNLIHAYFNE
jgi:dTDP-4-amino-4,6-dideoxygalactose transaminase